MPKVLFCFPFAIIGGAEIQTYQLIKGLIAKGYECAVATPDVNLNQPFYKELGNHCNIASVPKLEQLANLIRQYKPDLIQHFHSERVHYAYEQSGHRCQIVEVIHGRKAFPGDSTTTSKTHVQAVVCVSEDSKTFFHSRLPRFSGRVKVIPNGVDITRFSPRATNETSFVNFLHMGRLCEEDKHVTKIIDACSKIPNKQAWNWNLLIVGDGSAKDMIASHARKLAPNNTQFFGYVQNSESYYNHANVYLSRSESEGFGLSIAEAAASGLPIVMWDCGGVSHYFTNGVNALIAKTDEEFNNAVSTIYANKELRLELGANAVKLARKNFSSQIMVDHYDGLYRELLGKVPQIRIETKAPQKRIYGMSNVNFTGVTNAVKSWVGESNFIAVHPEAQERNGLYAIAAVEKAAPDVLITGGGNNYAPLFAALKKRNPKLKIIATWHGTFSLNSFVPQDAEILSQYMSLCNSGIIDKIGFVRPEQHRVFKNPEKFIYFPNFMPAIPNDIPKLSLGAGAHVGLFGTGYPWKNAHHALAALSLIKDCTVHTNNYIKAGRSLYDQLGLKIAVHGQLPYKQHLSLIKSVDCNVVPSFTEASTRYFRESYMLGVPCATMPGVALPNALRFTTVEDPDDPVALVKKVIELVDNPRIEEAKSALEEERKTNEKIVWDIINSL